MERAEFAQKVATALALPTWTERLRALEPLVGMYGASLALEFLVPPVKCVDCGALHPARYMAPENRCGDCHRKTG